MSADNDQFNSCTGPSKSSWRHWKKALKRSTVRLARRLGRRLLEDAPKRRTAGWTY